jgi:hypothetical protein
MGGSIRVIIDSPQRIQMDINHEMLEISILLAHDRLVPVLKELPAAPMTVVETHHVSGEQPPHQNADASWPAAKQKVGVVVQKRPGVASRARLRQQRAQPLQHVLAVVVLSKNFAPFDPTDHHVLQNPGRIQSRDSWHVRSPIRDKS